MDFYNIALVHLFFVKCQQKQIEVQEANLVEPGEHISDVARRIMSVKLDGARSASGPTDGQSVYERANEELAASGAVLV